MEITDLQSLIENVTAHPDNIDEWDHLESLAQSLEQPGPVADLYRQTLDKPLKKSVLLALGERAAHFIEDWYADEPDRLIEILRQLLEIDPSSESIFERLTMAFTVAQRWSDLIATYDAAIEAATGPRRLTLLEEATEVARDVAGLPNQAIDYLKRLVPERPDDTKLRQNLERLLEKQERWSELLELWNETLADLDPADREAMLVKLATCRIDNLNDSLGAATSLEALLAEFPENRDGTSLLERIATNKDESAASRERSLDVLRAHYLAIGHRNEIVRVLEAIISFASKKELRALHEEAGERLAQVGDDARAMKHFSALLAIEPSSAIALEQLRKIAQRSGYFQQYAEGLANAAEQCNDVSRRVSLLSEAARTYLDILDDESRAIELYHTAMVQDGIPGADLRQVTRRLNDLLATGQRSAERLVVLERLASVEEASARRRLVLGEIGHLAAGIGEIDRSLVAWRERLELDPQDMTAVDSIISLLERSEAWEELIEALEQRLAISDTRRERHSDLVRIATIYSSIGKTDKAIEAWIRVQKECGHDGESIDALSALLAHTKRWGELTELLDGTYGPEARKVAERLVRLGDALRESGTSKRALDCYRDALRVFPEHDKGREGLGKLLDDPSLRGEAAEILAANARDRKDWVAYLDLVEPRVTEAASRSEQYQLLREAARIQEHEIKDVQNALATLTRAFPLAPTDRRLEADVERLAAQTESWEMIVIAYRQGADVVDEAEDIARLRRREGKILEEHMDQPGQAKDAYMAVLDAQPENLSSVRGVLRTALVLQQFEDAGQAVATYLAKVQTLGPRLVEALEGIASKPDAGGPLADAIAAALHGRTDALPSHVAFEILYRAAVWHRDRAFDNTSAARLLRQALTYDPQRTEALSALAEIESAQPNAQYVDTLLQLADVDRRNLESLYEAAKACMALRDEKRLPLALNALLSRSVLAWRGATTAKGSQPPEVYVRWALEGLVDLYLDSQKPAAAIDHIIECLRLPFDTTTLNAFRKRAADIAVSQLKDSTTAVEMYHAVLREQPDDTEALDGLAQIYENETRIPDLLALRRKQLEVTEAGNARLTLRLEIARLVGELEKIGGRLEALQTNLRELPGHDPSIDALSALLDSQSEHKQLADVLEEQAELLHDAGDEEKSAELLLRAANIAERQLEDVDRAIACHRAVATRAGSSVSMMALSRMYMEKGEPYKAIPWLERSIGSIPPDDREDAVLQLVGAYIDAGKLERACTRLQSQLDDSTPAPRIRVLLADLYRQHERWDHLAAHLIESAQALDDHSKIVAFAREAASIYRDKLGSPGRAVAALEKAQRLAAEDQRLRLDLAIALRHDNKPEAALEHLQALLAAYGRRRSPERAAVHSQIASINIEQGDIKAGIVELETAAKMDSGNGDIQFRLAGAYRDAERYKEAERTLRALLLSVRRQQTGDEIDTLGVSEVLLELSDIAKRAGNQDEAKELRDSAFDAARQGSGELKRLGRALIRHDEATTLLVLLREAEAASDDDRDKARLHSEMAALLAGKLDRAQDALAAQLLACSLVPLNVEYFRTARELANATKTTKSFIRDGLKPIDRLRRDQDAAAAAEILLVAADALEFDAGDVDEAIKLLERVAQGEHQVADALFGLARIHGERDNREGQSEALERLLDFAQPSGDHNPIDDTERLDALYKIANLCLDVPRKRDLALETLNQAFTADPRYHEAGTLIRKAAELGIESPQLEPLYRNIARGSGDNRLLLDYLDWRASRANASPDDIKAAAEQAVAVGEGKRGEALLLRALENAQLGPSGLASAIWAVAALVEIYVDDNNFDAAFGLLGQSVDAASSEEIIQLGLYIAGAARSRDKTLAASIYEFVHQQDLVRRVAWQPLIELVDELGETERLRNAVSVTLPSVVDATERNVLRFTLASHVWQKDKAATEASDLLRDLLLDDPTHSEGASLYESILRTTDDDERLREFLRDRFEDACNRGDPDGVASAALPLGAELTRSDDTEAKDVYERALSYSQAHPELLRRLIDIIPATPPTTERLSLMERLLPLEEQDHAIQIALELADAYHTMADDDGYQRVLEAGFRVAPKNRDIRDRLEAWYRERELWHPLATMLHAEGQSTDDAGVAITQLREAARIYAELLQDPYAAAESLMRARDHEPSNADLVVEIAARLEEASQLDKAIEVVGESLDTLTRASDKVTLLALRGLLWQKQGNHGPAIDDLESAYKLDPDQIRPRLAAAWEAQRKQAAGADIRDGERRATLRLAQLMDNPDDLETGRQLLRAWTEREPSDRDALVHLRDAYGRAHDHWDTILAANTRLIDIDTDDDQITDVLELADAADKLERPDAAMRGLEKVLRAQPLAQKVRDRLFALYEATGETKKLAAMIIAACDASDDPAEQFSGYARATKALLDAEDPHAAIDPARKAFDIKPEDHDALTLCVDVYTQVGDLDSAIAVLEPAIEKHKRRSPQLAQLQLRRARLAAAAGDQSAQLEWLRKAFDVDRKSGVIAAELAQLATDMGDYALALKPLRAITLMDDPGPISRVMALLWEAKIEHARGNTAKAELWAKKALREDPTFADAQEFLSEITS